MSRSTRTTSSREEIPVGTHASVEHPALDQSSTSAEGHGEKEKKRKEYVVKEDVQKDEKAKETKEVRTEATDSKGNYKNITTKVLITGETLIYPGETATATIGVRPRPRLTTSNSGAEIMLGLQTDDGKSAEVEIDSLETDELQPEEIPKGRVRKTSIVEKLSKSKESELIALSIMESAGQRQREFEKLISEHQELVQEISRTPSAENIVQSETGRDP